MSFSEHQAQSLMAPLLGKTATFILGDRGANLNFARSIIALLSQAGIACAVVDFDAFYSSNSDQIFGGLDESIARATMIHMPKPGADIETEFSTLFGAQQKVVVVDSLNSFYHLISLEDGSSRSRKISFAIASLSYFARTNGKAVILSTYRREGFSRGGTGRSISALSDVTASVEPRGEEMTFRVERGSVWPGGSFSIRVPSGEPYRCP